MGYLSDRLSPSSVWAQALNRPPSGPMRRMAADDTRPGVLQQPTLVPATDDPLADRIGAFLAQYLPENTLVPQLPWDALANEQRGTTPDPKPTAEIVSNLVAMAPGMSLDEIQYGNSGGMDVFNTALGVADVLGVGALAKPFVRAGVNVAEDVINNPSVARFLADERGSLGRAGGVADALSGAADDAARVADDLPMDEVSRMAKRDRIAALRAEANANRAGESVDDYAGMHRPPMRDSGAPAHDLTGGGAVYPDDVYSPNAVQYYGTGNPAMDQETVEILNSLKGNPDEMVSIYRAVPSDASGAEISAGDWVTVNRNYAIDHGEGTLRGDYSIIERKVPARDIYTNGDSIHEFGFDPARADDAARVADDVPMDEVGRMARANQTFPVDAWHGSPRNITEFRNTYSTPEGHYGANHYFTNSIDDVNANYADHGGPDITQRIQREIELAADSFDDDTILDYWQYRDVDVDDIADLSQGQIDEALDAVARERLGIENDGTVYPVRLAMNNPVKVGGDGETFFDYNIKYSADGEDIVGEDGPFVDLLRATQEAFDEWQVDQFTRDDVLGKLMDDAIDGGISASDFDNILRSNINDVYDDFSGKMASPGAVIADIFKKAGFDSIDMDASVFSNRQGFGGVKLPGMTGTQDARHYVIFDDNANQIRSRFAKFDPRNINSRDLLASGLGGLTLGYGLLGNSEAEASQ